MFSPNLYFLKANAKFFVIGAVSAHRLLVSDEQYINFIPVETERFVNVHTFFQGTKKLSKNDFQDFLQLQKWPVSPPTARWETGIFVFRQLLRLDI